MEKFKNPERTTSVRDGISRNETKSLSIAILENDQKTPAWREKQRASKISLHVCCVMYLISSLLRLLCISRYMERRNSETEGKISNLQYHVAPLATAWVSTRYWVVVVRCFLSRSMSSSQPHGPSWWRM